jgi:hypothetical protein
MGRAIAREEPRRFRRALVFATLGVGTKDQAYALFLLAAPLAIVLLLMLDPRARARWRSFAREIAVATALSLALLLIVDGAFTNPSGFARRVDFLLGPASQDHAIFAASWEGRYQVLKSLATGTGRFHPWPFAALALIGIGVHVGANVGPGRGAKLIAGLLPLLAALSFVVCFNFTARRTEHRFALPSMLLLSVYAGFALDALLGACRARRQRTAAVLGAALLFGWSLFGSLAVDANMLGDPRYDAEAWMRANFSPGDSVEVYGVNAYLPRFPEGAKITRVDLSPVGGRNPLPDVTEVQARFEDIESRRPAWIVLPDAWGWRYLAGAPPEGRIVQSEQVARQTDRPARAYFGSLWDQTGPYALAHLSAFESKVWPPVDIHASLSREIRIYRRRSW